MSTLKFAPNEALQYQLYMVDQLLVKQNKDLQIMQTNQQHQMEMGLILNESPSVWNSMTEVLKPSAKFQALDKDIAFKQELVNLLKAKKKAILLMLADNKCPKVPANNYVTLFYIIF